MKYKLFTRVALHDDFNEYGLLKGDVATIIEYHEGSSDVEPGYTLEIFNAIGDTISIITVPESQIEPLLKDEIFQIRKISIVDVKNEV